MDDGLLSAIFTVIGLGSLVVWGVLIARIRQGEAPLKPIVRTRTVPWNGVDVLIILAIAIAVQLLVVSWFELEAEAPLSEMTPRELARVMAAFGFANLVAVACGFCVLAMKTGASEYELGMPSGGGQLFGDLGIGLAGFLFAVPVVYLIQYGLTQMWAYEHPIQDMLTDQTGVYFWAVAGLSAAVAAPIVEEFFFRLLLMGWLEKLEHRVRAAGRPLPPPSSANMVEEEPTFSPELPTSNHPSTDSSAFEDNPFLSPETVSQDARAREDLAPAELAGQSFNAIPQSSMMPVVVSSVLFSMMHIGQGPAPIPLFFLSLVLGYLYRQTHRLLPCVFLHMIFNGFALVIMKLSL